MNISKDEVLFTIFLTCALIQLFQNIEKVSNSKDNLLR